MDLSSLYNDTASLNIAEGIRFSNTVKCWIAISCFNIAFQFKNNTEGKKKKALTFRCNSMIKEQWIEKQTAKANNIGNYQFLRSILGAHFKSGPLFQ